MAKKETYKLGKGLAALLENTEKATKNNHDKAVKQYDEDKLYPKTIHLYGHVLNRLEVLAAEDKRKIKPYMEKQLEEITKRKK